MLSLSVAFHVGSALLLVYLFVRLAQYRRWLRLFRRWSDPKAAGVIVGEPCKVIGDFAAALDIPCIGSVPKEEEPVRVSLASLFRLHEVCGIQEIEFMAANIPAVSFTLRRSSATIEEDQSAIEISFANKLQVKLISPR